MLSICKVYLLKFMFFLSLIFTLYLLLFFYYYLLHFIYSSIKINNLLILLLKTLMKYYKISIFLVCLLLIVNIEYLCIRSAKILIKNMLNFSLLRIIPIFFSELLKYII